MRRWSHSCQSFDGNAVPAVQVAVSLSTGVAITMRQRRPVRALQRENSMNLHLALTPIVSLIAGILILIVPRLLNVIVAIYLILIGLIGLFPALTA